MNVTVREFRPEDLETAWRLDQQCFAPSIAYSRAELVHFLNRRGAFAFVAEADGAMAGFMIGERATRRPAGHVITLDVAAPYRRRGIATALMQRSDAHLAESGAEVVYLETAINNQPAIAFYKRHGYYIVKTIPRYYNGMLDAFMMAKRLVEG